ncbi:odorant receptor 10-like [Megachile rotundata]|uniref:odorant receptor 10-like n=1 Tax=Megachile rotundata TaxID=143995 RepID=UPI003FCFA67A
MIDESTIQQNPIGLSDYSLQLNRWFLKPIGAWPVLTSRNEKIVSLTLNVICYCSILVTVVPCLLRIFLEDDDLLAKLKMTGAMSHCFAGGLNYTTLLLRRKEIHYCIKQINSDWRTVKRPDAQQVMLKDAKFGRSVAAFCAIFMQGGVFCFSVATVFTMEIVQVGNETRAVHTFPCPAYRKLIPVDNNFLCEIFLAVQFLCVFVVNSTIVGAFSLAIVFASHVYGQLDILMVWVTEYVNKSEEMHKNRWNQIGVFVENHVKILSFIAHIEQVMSPICLSELCQCTLSMCTLCYYIIMEWEEHDVQNLTSYAMILVSVTFNVFIMCYIGEVLMEQCNRVADVVYMTNWYCMPYRSILDLILIISRSNVVTKITAGKVIYMSIYTFGDVLKTAFTYLNILRQTT